jgi:hypothetical protein
MGHGQEGFFVTHACKFALPDAAADFGIDKAMCRHCWFAFPYISARG